MNIKHRIVKCNGHSYGLNINQLEKSNKIEFFKKNKDKMIVTIQQMQPLTRTFSFAPILDSKATKKRSVHVVHEHFEKLLNPKSPKNGRSLKNAE